MPPGAMPYALFALIGTTLWGFFTQASIAAIPFPDATFDVAYRFLQECPWQRLRDLREGHDAWPSGEEMFESARAISVGRMIREEMRTDGTLISSRH